MGLRRRATGRSAVLPRPRTAALFQITVMVICAMLRSGEPDNEAGHQARDGAPKTRHDDRDSRKALWPAPVRYVCWSTHWVAGSGISFGKSVRRP
jgi:hypothetical protein